MNRTAPNGLAALRKSRGLTQEQAAERAHMSLGGYRKLEYGERQLKADQISLFAGIFDASPADVMRAARPEIREVPLVGYVGAGAAAHYYADAQGPFEMVTAPDGANASTVAVEIRGESLGALFNQWLVFYDEVRSPVTPDMIGKLCVVGLPDDRVLVKQIKSSRTPGRYHLISNTEGPMLDEEVAWAAKVKNMVPR